MSASVSSARLFFWERTKWQWFQARLIGFRNSYTLYAALYRAGKRPYHDCVDYLAVVAELAGVPFETAAPIIREALMLDSTDHDRSSVV